MKPENIQPDLIKDRTSSDSNLCYSKWEGEPTRRPRVFILIGQNQCRNVKAIVLKLVITKGRNYEHRDGTSIFIRVSGLHVAVGQLLVLLRALEKA